ncbi:hypothetical protein BN946_scf184996.g25 [Trametes cinnabarina]|uniref:WH1 domain-containing protein n=1 Tax=Pycnoporus cinnabarinus TaxID=5643 RepID=A0A060S8I5_PYCCI|nr:hypothetical protein BN946_scf184996.g25 [Trametes cinnabarina]
MAQSFIPRSPAATISSLASGPEDIKRQVLSYLPPDSKVLATASARIYHSAFNAAPDAWTFTGLRGMLVFGRNQISIHPDRPFALGEGATSIEQSYWFRLVDLDSGKGIVWFHQIPPNLDYQADKPFFHVFSGCSRMFGFRFDEDLDAEHFLKRVTSRIQITAPGTPKSKANMTKSTSPSTRTRTVFPVPRRISPSMISSPSPGTFMHVAHLGVDSEGYIDASPNVEQGWTMILEELQGYGVSEKMVSQDLDFVEGFLAGAKAKLVQELQNTPATSPAMMTRTPTVASGKKGRFMMPRRKATNA